MAEFKHYKEESRKKWGTDQEEALTLDQINTGAVLRIADATEAMAVNFNELIAKNKRLTDLVEHSRTENKQLSNKVRGLKASITRLKNKNINHSH
jgi:phage shock protein A